MSIKALFNLVLAQVLKLLSIRLGTITLISIINLYKKKLKSIQVYTFIYTFIHIYIYIKLYFTTNIYKSVNSFYNALF